MKRIYFHLLNATIFLLLVSGCRNVNNPQIEELAMLKQMNSELIELVAPPPASMDNFYPPKAEAPVFLFSMLEMNTPFTGIVVDLFENDFENVIVDFENFKALYTEIPKMVPEWKNKFPMDVVDELGKALETKDPGKIMPAYEAVGKVCYDCHALNMAKVQLKYHWRDMSTIMVHDPLTNEEVSFSQFKHYMASAAEGIGIDLQQGQLENAKLQFQAFNARFQAFKETCQECHSTERLYYVDDNTQAIIDRLGKELDKPDINMEKVGRLAQGIGMGSCMPCHHVHTPAYGARHAWELWEKIGN